MNEFPEPDSVKFQDGERTYEIVLDAQTWSYRVLRRIKKGRLVELDDGPMPVLKWYTPKGKSHH